jgi:hypothetical protein
MTYRKRAFTALVAGALALPLLATPASAAPGDTATPPVQDIEAFCTNPTAEQFSDVRSTDTFALAIRCIATAGITVGGPNGIPEDQYGPNLSVKRGQMASFIARLLDAAEERDRNDGGDSQIQELGDYDGTNEFTDVPDNDVHVATINRLADAGVVKGGVAGEPETLYSPDDRVTRAQMASFINRAAAFAMNQDPNNSGMGTGYTAPDDADYYDDDENIQIHEPNINGITSVGIAVGTTDDKYNPTAEVTRAQMAGFLSRTLSQFFDDDLVHSLLELFTGDFSADSMEDMQRTAATGTPTDNRAFSVDNLNPDVEYRVTLVDSDLITRDEDDLVEFTEDMNTGLAATGSPDARITQVNGDEPNNNSGVGTADSEATITAVAEPDDDGELTFEIEGNSSETVTAVLYINGGDGRELDEGGDSPRLELGDEERPVEFFGISGETEFVAAGDGGDGGQGQGATISDAGVATDAAMATAGGTATDTASEGDFFELTLSESVATGSATSTSGATATFEDDNGDSFTIECVDGLTAPFAPLTGNTPATCTVEEQENDFLLTIELLADPTVTGDGDGVADFPLEITETNGFTDEDGNEIDLEGSVDTSIERDATTDDTDDPSSEA